mmetsp:Transcript_26209/g.74262  ORF Transcript_26209/g.74262 Transcript_26209/m.74262 type:complete len:281 (+) Transcript_26209:102-944(+)
MAAATEPIYHEKQYGSMCGQHCLNNLLQGPYFQAEDLANIAHELDEQERKLIGGAAGGESNNVDEAGNFSVQVLSTAIQRGYDLSMVQDRKATDAILKRLEGNDASLSKGDDVAFVCNLRNHWFALRSLRGEMWNLNSLKKRPEKISLFYLSAFLAQLREEGYSIFVVKGMLPVPLQDMGLGRREDWFVPGVDDKNVLPDPKRVSLHADDPNEEAQLQAALRESMRSNGSGAGMDEALAAAIAMSLSEAEAPKGRGDDDGEDESDGDRLRRGLAASRRRR